MKIGDLVRLNSETFNMTVEKIVSGDGDRLDQVHTIWFDESELFRAQFRPEVLMLIGEETEDAGD